MATDFEIPELTGTHTTSEGTWDPTVNAVSYQRAEVSLPSNSDDDLGAAARAVPERVDWAMNPESASHERK